MYGKKRIQFSKDSKIILCGNGLSKIIGFYVNSNPMMGYVLKSENLFDSSFTDKNNVQLLGETKNDLKSQIQKIYRINEN